MYVVFKNGIMEYSTTSLFNAFKFVGGNKKGWGNMMVKDAINNGWSISLC